MDTVNDAMDAIIAQATARAAGDPEILADTRAYLDAIACKAQADPAPMTGDARRTTAACAIDAANRDPESDDPLTNGYAIGAFRDLLTEGRADTWKADHPTFDPDAYADGDYIGFTGQGEPVVQAITDHLTAIWQHRARYIRSLPCHALAAHAAIWTLYGPRTIRNPFTQDTVSAGDITRMVETVDSQFEPMVRDYGDLPGTHPVYRIGDWGWVREDQWDAVFAPWPDWAPYAYEIDANAFDYEHLRDRIASAVNHGGSTSLRQWCDALMDANQFDTVFYTEVGQDC